MNEDKEPPLLESVGLVWTQAIDVFAKSLSLATAEARLAVMTVFAIANMAMIACVLFIATIALLEISLALWLMNIGINLPLCLTLIAALNLLVAALLVWKCRQYSRYLLFEKTIHSLNEPEECVYHGTEQTH